ncbi:hypothetical protein QBC44DRAFT_368328 [Cladorrhinum sp. PSN332]|nr:hypothetical protein QBC44DRAFT_368328 [Cladorrhinum sp. PSN332]
MAVTDNSNPFVSNGTCYWIRGNVAEEHFVPCGNQRYGHTHCCWLGAMCLEYNACYSFWVGATYLAGCTNPDYKDASCPDKRVHSDQQWTGMRLCNNDAIWAAGEESSPTMLTRGDKHDCPPTPTPIIDFFGSKIPDMGQLDSTSGGLISFVPSHAVSVDPLAPTDCARSISTSTSSTAAVAVPNSTTNVASTIPPGTSLSSVAPTISLGSETGQAGRLNTAEKVGIAVGAFGLLILILGAI